MKTKWNIIKCYSNVALLLLIVLLLYSVINWLTPIWYDDLDYGNQGHTFSDIFHREFHDYFYVNGRFFSHSLVQVFAGILGKPMFNLVNPIMTMFLIVLIPIASGLDWKTESNKWFLSCVLSLSLLLVWFVLPDQYITMFMIAGSSNYIWASVLNLLFVCVFMRILAANKAITTWQWIGVVALSFFAGAWMEMYSLALAPALFIFLLLHKEYWNKKSIISFVCYGMGTAIVVFAPGNFVRQEFSVQHSQIDVWLVNQLELAIRFGLIWVWLLSLVLLIVALVKKQITLKSFANDNVVWLVGILVSYAFLYVSGIISFRPQWGIFIYSFIVMFYLLRMVRIDKIPYVVVSVVAIAFVLVDFSKECRACQAKNKAVSKMLYQAKTNSLVENRFFLWPETESTRKSIPSPSELNGQWPGSYFSAFHHLRDFVIMPEVAYSYCSGEKNDFPLYYNLFPMIEDNVIVKCVDSSCQNVTIEYEFESPKAYVLQNKIRRLLEAMGFEGFARKTYASKDELLLGGILLRELDVADMEVVVSTMSNARLFDYCGSRYWVIPLEDMKPKFDIAVVSCKLQ